VPRTRRCASLTGFPFSPFAELPQPGADGQVVELECGVGDEERQREGVEARFTDQRFRPGLRDKTDVYLPVLGAKGNNVSAGATPVTEADWAKFKGKADAGYPNVTFRVIREDK